MDNKIYNFDDLYNEHVLQFGKENTPRRYISSINSSEIYLTFVKNILDSNIYEGEIKPTILYKSDVTCTNKFILYLLKRRYPKSKFEISNDRITFELCKNDFNLEEEIRKQRLCEELQAEYVRLEKETENKLEILKKELMN